MVVTETSIPMYKKKPVRTILESLQKFDETSFKKKKKNRSRTDFRFSTYLFDVTKNFLAARHALMDNSSQRGFWGQNVRVMTVTR
jgi:hypothetical protein